MSIEWPNASQHRGTAASVGAPGTEVPPHEEAKDNQCRQNSNNQNVEKGRGGTFCTMFKKIQSKFRHFLQINWG